jgi:ribosomal protein S18 acetylase RimI-like enzyme
MVNLEKADYKLYSKFKTDLEQLYINTFTTGISAQKISDQEAENYLKSMFEVGYGIFGFSEHQLIAALIAVPVDHDKERPEDIKNKFKSEDTLYIAEVLVDRDFRGQGLGKGLMQVYQNHLEPEIKHTLLRVWEDNVAAVALYEKSGFKTCGFINQEKIRPHTHKKFIMRKRYMIKSH